MEAGLLVDRDGTVCTLTIHQPERRNVLNVGILRQLGEHLSALAEDKTTRVVVLRGAGEEAFSAGYDIGEIPSGEQIAREDPMELATRAVEACPLPVIAMIHGFCIGGGLDLAASCDLRVAADNARLGITPAKLGLVYNHRGILRFVDLVGVSRTRELFYTGRLVPAPRALQMGLVDRVVPSADLLRETSELAREIADNAPLAIRGTKHTINRLLQCREPGPEVIEELVELKKQAFDSEDRHEGQRAFREKRKPVFRGR